MNAANVNTEQRSVNTSIIPLKEWKSSFDGNGGVSDFLFKIDTLSFRNIVPPEKLIVNFNVFLTDVQSNPIGCSLDKI